MAGNKNHLKEWSGRLETGERDDELLAVAARLERAAVNEPSAPPVEFRRQLRRDLLNEYKTIGNRPASRLWRLAGSVAVLGLLGVIVVTIWLSVSSAGRSIPGDAPVGSTSMEMAVTLTPSPSGYTFIDYSITGGIVMEQTKTDGGATQMNSLLVPGMAAEITTRWRAPAPPGQAPLFSLHLLDSEGRIVAQSDASVQAVAGSDEQAAEATLTLDIPADLAPGNYELSGGLFEAATAARLSYNTAAGEVMWLIRADFVVPDGPNANLVEMDETIEALQGESATPIFQIDIDDAQGDMLVVREVSPPNGAAIGGTAPVDFVVTVDYAIKSLPQAILEVRVVDLQGEEGRGVGLATVDNILQGTGTTTVVVVVDLGKELAGSTDLGLWLQFKPDATSAPVLIEMPEGYRWRYNR